ncbi:MAG TPA: LacI family DNA-binding transcriptional regulator [Gemmatimonadales bacterium]|nr:LacI family DNA-binding transcriptional regulator [Gemmatimonadales bacterium]
MAGSATIKHVAKEAGVSVATVSRVMNKSALVAEGTRQVVLEVAARLGYTPHGAARSLITNRTSTVGVLLPDLYGEFFSEVIRGIDQTARREGYHVIVSSSHSDQQDLESALRSMWGRVDGLILMIPDIRVAGIASQLPDGFPVVLMNCAGDTNGHDAISIANYEGAYSMVQHLIGKGHRRIAIIKGADKNYDANERLRGYRAALRDAALPGEAALEVAGDFSEASGYDAASGLARLDPRPTAIFAFNDAMAVGALSAIREARLRVPEDIAVAGFDDIPMARYVEPPLSSVHVDISALGARAATLLLGAIQHPNGRENRREIVPTALVVRRSCGS